MKAALLGLSHPHAELLCRSLESLADVTELILWDPDPAVVARWKARSAATPSEVTEDLNGVLERSGAAWAVVCLPTDQTAAISGRVLSAGLHLLTEKPAGLTPAEIAELARLASVQGKVASVLYPRRFHPCMTAARRWVQDGLIGPIYNVEARFLTTQVQFRDPGSWLFRARESGGGILSWLGCHCLDLIHYVTGQEITQVAASLATRSGEPIEVEDNAALSFRLGSGAVGTLLTGYTLAYSGAGYANHQGYDSYLGFNGRTGRIVWPDLGPRLHVESPPALAQSAGREETFPDPPSAFYGGSGGEHLFHRFLGAMAGHGPPPTTLRDAARIAGIIAAAYRSAQTGRFEPVRYE